MRWICHKEDNPRVVLDTPFFTLQAEHIHRGCTQPGWYPWFLSQFQALVPLAHCQGVQLIPPVANAQAAKHLSQFLENCVRVNKMCSANPTNNWTALFVLFGWLLGCRIEGTGILVYLEILFFPHKTETFSLSCVGRLNGSLHPQMGQTAWSGTPD